MANTAAGCLKKPHLPPGKCAPYMIPRANDKYSLSEILVLLLNTKCLIFN